MISRLTFLAIVAFWLTMNILLWRTEYGSHGGEIPIPVELVWRKILTAPDSSSLTIYQNNRRSGFCEFSTSVEQEMARLDADKPPPEGMIARAGYQVHLNGNMSLGSFTNRVKFDGRVRFNKARVWQELQLKLTFHLATVEIHSIATNQTVHLVVTSGKAVVTRNIPLADLQNPSALLREFSGGYDADFLDEFDLPQLSPATLEQSLQWHARRDRLVTGHEPVPVYRLETEVLGHPVVIIVSTIGEIMRIELPDDIIATLDEWNNP